MQGPTESKQARPCPLSLLMNYLISPDGQRLTLTVDTQERALLLDMTNEELSADDTMFEFFEKLIGNSELEWVRPEECGDLTEAPMLGIYGPETTTTGGRHAGNWPAQDGVVRAHYHPVMQRWAWMDYQVRSLLSVLRDTGSAALVGGC